MESHNHREADQRRWTLDGLQGHVRRFHPSMGPPGIERDASFRTLAAAHRREHGQPEPLAGRGNLLSLDSLCGLYERISLEFSHTWPGQAYLRFEAPGGAVTMVRVNEADRGVLSRLLGEA